MRCETRRNAPFAPRSESLSEVGEIEMPDGARVRARIGIATGLVVVGEIIGAGSAQERTIVGETPNLAARLQALADADCILVSETTQNLVRGLFELEPTGDHDLKGFARPVPVWRVVGEAAVVTRFAAIRTGAATPLIGRAHEMGLILDRWRLARGGEGQIVTLIGEPGIGKSRSVEALQEAIAGEQHGCIYFQCSSHHSDSALYPVIQHIARTAEFAAADLPEVPVGKLGACSRIARHRCVRNPAAGRTSVNSGRAAGADIASAAQRKTATIALLVDEIVRLGDARPMLLIVEDAH